MGKMTKSNKKQKTPSKGKYQDDVPMADLDDEIDTFHKKRDMIPLDMNDDTDTDDDDDKDMEVFDYEGIDGEDDDEDEDDEDGDEDDDDDDYSNDRGLAGKIARQLKYLKEKTGGVDDDLQDNSEEDEKKETLWIGRNKYEDGVGDEFSDEETLAEVEEEAKRMLKEKAKSMREEDFGLPTVERDGSDVEPTLGELITGKTKMSGDKEAEGDSVSVFEVKKDLNALSSDEQMDILESSAPELADLLEEFKDAIDQLETQVNPLLGLVRKSDNADKKGMHYLEVKRVLLLAYCQAITFYLLLKSEGQPPHDHPVMGRLDEIKSLLAKMKELDEHLPDGLENLLNEKKDIVPAKRPAAQQLAPSSDLRSDLNDLARFSEKQEVSKFVETAEPVKLDGLEVVGKKRRKDKLLDEQVSRESGKMLQHRTVLEEKLKQKAVSISAAKTDGNKIKKSKRNVGQLQTIDDFDDEAVDLEGVAQGTGRSSTLMSKVSKIITARGKKMLKGVSGDDDLPERDDLGARRLKHEAHILANVGITATDGDDLLEHEQSESEGDDVEGGSDSDVEGGSDSGAEYYKLVQESRANKLREKALKNTRNPQELDESEMTVDGKRHITTNMEKNRGLTRQRKKIDKNPRKKYRGKYQNKLKSRKGQVRDVRKPIRPYDGEAHGINAIVSKSRRL